MEAGRCRSLLVFVRDSCHHDRRIGGIEGRLFRAKRGRGLACFGRNLFRRSGVLAGHRLADQIPPKPQHLDFCGVQVALWCASSGLVVWFGIKLSAVDRQLRVE